MPRAWFSRARVDVLSLADGRRKKLVDGATFGRFVADSEGTGYLTFVRSGTLFAAAFDPVRLELQGPPFAVFEGVAYDDVGAAQMDASRAGTLIVRRQMKFHVAWLENAGSTPLFADAGDYVGPMPSRAGDRVAFTAQQDVWVYDLHRHMRTQVTKGLAASGSKVWSVDDQFIVFSTPEGIWYVRADGGSEPRLLLPTEAPLVRVASSITGDRHTGRLAFHQLRPSDGGKWDQWTVPIVTDGTGMRAGKPEPFLQTRDDERHLDFSADGRWVAYSSSEEGGRHETFVRSFPDDGRRWKISDGGGMMPRWSPERPELFFQAGEALMVAPVPTPRRSLSSLAAPGVVSAAAGDPTRGTRVCGVSRRDERRRNRSRPNVRGTIPEARHALGECRCRVPTPFGTLQVSCARHRAPAAATASRNASRV